MLRRICSLVQLLLLLLCLAAISTCTTRAASPEAETGTESSTNNWAVLVCTSRYWFNYRVHLAS